MLNDTSPTVSHRPTLRNCLKPIIMMTFETYYFSGDDYKMKVYKITHDKVDITNRIIELLKTPELSAYEPYCKDSERPEYEYLNATIKERNERIKYQNKTSIRDAKQYNMNVLTNIKADIENEICNHEKCQECIINNNPIELNLRTAEVIFPSSKNLSIGTYTLHPCDGKRLTRVESYHNSLALEKDDELIVILGKLGAKSVRIYESEEGDSSFNASVSADAILASGKSSGGTSTKFMKEMDLMAEYEGNRVAMDDNLLENSIWFKNDSHLNSILQSRLNKDNRILKYKLENTYTESFDFDFEVAAKFIKFGGNLESDYKELRNRKRIFHVEFA